MERALEKIGVRNEGEREKVNERKTERERDQSKKTDKDVPKVVIAVLQMKLNSVSFV